LHCGVCLWYEGSLVFVVAYCVEVLFLERLWCAGLCMWGIDKGGRFKIGVGVCASGAYRSR
jgi:hypothetical protein